MYKRVLLTGIVVVSMILTMVPPASAQSVKLSFWHYWDGANGQALEQLIRQFEKQNPDIDIEPVFVPGSELLTKLRTALVSGRTPAMAIADLVNMPLLSQSGKLVALDTFIANSKIDLNDFYPALLVYGKYTGKRYSLPVSASNLALYWNKDLFAKAGLDPNRPPKTWTELVAFGKQIREKTGKWGFELYTQGGEGTTWQWQVFLWSAGGDFLNADLSGPAFNSPEGERALQFWVDLVKKHGISTIAPWGLFGRGEAAMVMDGSWMTQFFPMQVSFELGAAVFPAADGGQPATNLGGEQIFIMSQKRAEQEAAWRFIEWFTSRGVQVEWDKMTGFIPVRRSVANDPSYRAWVANARPLLQAFVEAQEFSHPRPPVAAYPQISDTVAKAVVEALYGRATPAKALDDAAKQVQQLLK